MLVYVFQLQSIQDYQFQNNKYISIYVVEAKLLMHKFRSLRADITTFPLMSDYFTLLTRTVEFCIFKKCKHSNSTTSLLLGNLINKQYNM